MKSKSEAWKEIHDLAEDGLPSAICLMDIQERLKDKCNNLDKLELKARVNSYIQSLELSWAFPRQEILQLLKEVEAAL